MAIRQGSKRAQGAIEYLLIIGAAILVVAIVILAVTGALGTAKVDANSTANETSSALDALRNLQNNTPSGTPLSSCTIGSSGTYYLSADLVCSSDLIIETDNVTINGNGKTITGNVNTSRSGNDGDNGYPAYKFGFK